ncbi:hypothetical protein M878_28975 [Streptomyces roseochromogenus subsp. oscitans DS 12.976]|uniref:Uncharacterized protein n=1 Tax=Streptomyces roseochromogenus subsp. oscitans DS 12.976 TaxID=1352936 RepID=V6JZT2_STRRC|nr:hypothetical protein M878_28975 [Streptomyces roseochromogenus subsp. oscitans DS 12.976]
MDFEPDARIKELDLSEPVDIGRVDVLTGRHRRCVAVWLQPSLEWRSSVGTGPHLCDTAAASCELEHAEAACDAAWSTATADQRWVAGLEQ